MHTRVEEGLILGKFKRTYFLDGPFWHFFWPFIVPVEYSIEYVRVPPAILQTHRQKALVLMEYYEYVRLAIFSGYY